MSSILNSISSGDLQVITVSKEKPVKEDSFIELLQNSEIEFETCPKLEDKLDNINTGFGENNDLHFEDKCTKPELKVPLYQENYLSEFKTEEEKAAARHALGLYNKGDVVAMSLLTAEDNLPTYSDWANTTIKQLRKGDKFFTPITSFNAVYDAEGITLTTKFKEINSLIIEQQKEIMKINQVSGEQTISSLGDVKMFLQGFNNGENLHNIINQMDQEMLRFQKTGEITITKKNN